MLALFAFYRDMYYRKSCNDSTQYITYVSLKYWNGEIIKTQQNKFFRNFRQNVIYLKIFILKHDILSKILSEKKFKRVNIQAVWKNSYKEKYLHCSFFGYFNSIIN